MKVLQLTVHLFPNVGGVETHLFDLVNFLIRRKFNVFVLAYQPLSTMAKWKKVERKKNLTILRIPWVRGFFEKLVSYPSIEFMYLVPGLFIVTPFIILFYKPNVIHAHGLSAAVSAVFWGKLFKIRTVVSLHSYYSFPKKGIYHSFVNFLLQKSDFVLSLSKKSNEEVRNLGLEINKTGVFTYWVDLHKFKRIFNAKKKLGWGKEFIVLFVGRLVLGKGIEVLLQSTKLWDKNIRLVIIGYGPLESKISQHVKEQDNISFLGRIDQNELPIFYSGADCIIVPSTSKEGFGRVIIESLACETPVIASQMGATTEAMDETVGKFIIATPENIEDSVDYFYQNPKQLIKLSINARKFAESRYSEKNADTIIKAY